MNNFEMRVRYNWGFHDGTLDAREDQGIRPVRTMEGHQDQAYAAGYMAGVADFKATGARSDSSCAAWAAFAPFLAIDGSLKLHTDLISDAHGLYRAAMAADETFGAAVTAQFGPKATRWTSAHRSFNDATLAAYKTKVTADAAYLMHCRASSVAVGADEPGAVAVVLAAAPDSGAHVTDIRSSIVLNPIIVVVRNAAAAKSVCDNFIALYNLGEKNWTGGRLFDVESGHTIGVINHLGYLLADTGAPAASAA